MSTCPSCAALIEQDATECWHCGVAIVADAEAIAANTASGAPTMAAGDTPSARAHSSSSMIGREVIGQYVIADKLGEGGMGEVYLADQPAIGRQVAIKIVHPQTRERDHDDHVERFRNEAKAAASLESPHIVQIFNWGELDDGTLFMAMEYLAGRTLGEVLQAEGPFEPELTVAIAAQICTALAEAHAAGIVHRDLKPSNIMLIQRGDEPNFAKVLDFGVAKLEGSDITRSGAMFGTPQYMSPEQLRGDGLDGRSDLYSLGVVLYEMLAGELPFASPTAIGFITAHLHDQPPPLPANVPRALAEVVMMLLAKDANERPPDAMAVVAELRAALGGRSPAARRRARRRAMRRSLVTTLVLVSLVGLGYGSWQVFEWRAQTRDALARERARGFELEQQVKEFEAAVEQTRRQARAAAIEVRQTNSEVRERREQVQTRGGRTKPQNLDPETRAMLVRTRAQLEADLHEVFDERRVPPSEIEDAWTSHSARVAELEAGELEESELRDQLVSMIALYRKSFELKRREDRLPLERLERLFVSMRTKTALDEDQRRALLAVTYAEYDGDEALPEADRDYYKRLAVVKLIREHAADSQAAQDVDGESPEGASGKPKTADPAGSGSNSNSSSGSSSGLESGPESGSEPGPLPSADDEENEQDGQVAKSPLPPLPSVDGI